MSANLNILRRFVIYMAILTFVMFTVWAFVKSFMNRPPGDYETKRGDILLSSGDYPEALEYFDRALIKTPNHRGALMGRALVFIQTEQYPEAEVELTHLISWLETNISPTDLTGIGALAAAYANKGIILDRQGAYEEALANYIKALEVDEDSVSGPGSGYKILYDPRPSTVRKRALYIYEQMQLPEDQRAMRLPELDSASRMYKP